MGTPRKRMREHRESWCRSAMRARMMPTGSENRTGKQRPHNDDERSDRRDTRRVTWPARFLSHSHR
jgi:hypothetical protein